MSQSLSQIYLHVVVSPDGSRPEFPRAGQPRRWRRRGKWAAALLTVAIIAVAFCVKDYVRTLQSLRRVPGMNAFVMDYYADYHHDEEIWNAARAWMLTSMKTASSLRRSFHVSLCRRSDT